MRGYCMSRKERIIKREAQMREFDECCKDLGLKPTTARDRYDLLR